jgi:hypothetical protein
VVFGLAPGILTQPILSGWTIGPTITVNETNSSAPQTEVAITQRHSYGRQLGKMADAIEALIEKRPGTGQRDDPYVVFLEMKKKIDEIKLEATAERLDRLADELRAMKTRRPSEYEQLRDRLRVALDL